jgi:hypothetical protein
MTPSQNASSAELFIHLRALGWVLRGLPEQERIAPAREALSEASAISHAERRFSVLFDIALDLPEPERLEVVNKAVATLPEIQETDVRANVLNFITRRFDDWPLQRLAFKTACRLADDVDRAQALGGWTLRLETLPDESIKRVRVRSVLRITRSMRHDGARAYLLTFLAPVLNSFEDAEWRQKLSREALNIAFTISNDYDRAIALLGLSADLSDKALLLEVLDNITEESPRAFVRAARKAILEKAAILEKIAPPGTDIVPSVEEDGNKLDKYNAAKSAAANIFADLTPVQAIRTLSPNTILAVLAAFGVYAGKHITVIRSAFAQTHTFVPPLGLSQDKFTAIVIGFLILAGLLFIGLFYAGYIGKPKNQAAANTVNHFAIFVSGALTSALLSPP